MKNNIIAKSFLIWLGIIPLAFINGALREMFLIPYFGKIGLPISAIILCALIFLLSYIFIPGLGKSDSKTFIKIGILWAIATISFECLLGILMQKTISQIISAYDISTGNLWVMVIVFIGFVPTIIYKKNQN